MAAKAKDSVCGIIIEESDAVGTSDYEGKRYYFCSSDCKKEFDDKQASSPCSRTCPWIWAQPLFQLFADARLLPE